VLDANEIGPMNAGGGIRVASTTFTITNNIIGENRGGVGVRIDDNPAGSVIAFNTIVGNGAATDTQAGGIACNAATTIRASIVVSNSLTMASGTQFSGSCTLQSVVVGTDSTTDAGAIKQMPAFQSATNYRLELNNPANVGVGGCCVDKLAAPSPAPANLDHDIDRTTRPKGAGAMNYDIGAHEAQ
jgi:hypothetical protein